VHAWQVGEVHSVQLTVYSDPAGRCGLAPNRKKTQAKACATKLTQAMLFPLTQPFDPACLRHAQASNAEQTR
jgi:hypothetical protein